MILGLVLLALLVAVLYVRRARRANLLAGRNASKPVYSIEPPQRRIHSPRKDVL